MTTIKGKDAGVVNDVVVKDNMDFFQVRGAVSHARNVMDKALVIEREIGSDIIYSLISSGQSEHVIADALGLSYNEFKIVVTRTTEHSNKYIKAKLFPVVSDSVDTLSDFSGLLSMDKETKNASQHHKDMVKLFLDQTNNVETNSSAITVNNVITVSDNKSTPALPDGLDDILDGEYIDVNT